MNLNEQEIYLYGRRYVAFSCAENAWLWCCRCKVGLSGTDKHNQSGAESIPRPCETVDIYCVIKSLERKHLLTQEQIKIMVKYGLKLQSPSLKNGSNKFEIDLWNRAMEELDEPLRRKKIVL